jgi:hypothetical protein
MLREKGCRAAEHGTAAGARLGWHVTAPNGCLKPRNQQQHAQRNQDATCTSDIHTAPCLHLPQLQTTSGSHVRGEAALLSISPNAASIRYAVADGVETT